MANPFSNACWMEHVIHLCIVFIITQVRPCVYIFFFPFQLVFLVTHLTQHTQTHTHTQPRNRLMANCRP